MGLTKRDKPSTALSKLSASLDTLKVSVPPAEKLAPPSDNLDIFWLKDESLEDSNESDVSDQKSDVSQFLELVEDLEQRSRTTSPQSLLI